MFTGLIQHLGRALSRTPCASGERLRIDLAGWNHSPRPGDSIAVSGCCLTVVAAEDGIADFDLVPETLARTTLGSLTAGSRVNLEHAVTPQTLLGGHVVQGHVDATGVVQSVSRGGNEYRLTIKAPPELHDCIVTKGSVTVDGVSLTVAGRADETFDVALIPETLDRTSLGSLAVGDRVNLEVDYIARIVVSWLERRASAG